MSGLRRWRQVFCGAIVLFAALLGGPVIAQAAPPVVEILSPSEGFKLRPGWTMAVRVRVARGDDELREWVLQLAGGGQPEPRELARGAAAVDEQVVAEVAADTLVAAEPYSLRLSAADADAGTATAAVGFRVPDPPFALIPFEPGDFTDGFWDGMSVDASGRLFALGARKYDEIRIFNPTTGTDRLIQITDGATEGRQLSADGRRFYFRGAFPRSAGIGRVEAIGYVDLATDLLAKGPLTGIESFTVDCAGRRVALQSEENLDPAVGNPRPGIQYFLYDDETKAIRQLTTDPRSVPTIAEQNDPTFCLRPLATIPRISDDGEQVVLLTSIPLGPLAPDPGAGCYVSVYEVAAGTWRHVAALPKGISIDTPALSGDGRWLSFVVGRSDPPIVLRGFPALMDLQTGELTDPVGGIAGYTSFDSVITGDASRILISTQADLDPRVGNPDHNMELFVYERATGSFTQVTETVGGIGRHPGGCPSYRPRVSEDGEVMAFFFQSNDFGGCRLDGPQRNEADGFTFGRVRTVRRRPGNQGPRLVVRSTVQGAAGNTLTLPIAASDADGDAVTFFAQQPNRVTTNILPGSEFVDNRDGTAVFRWPTKPEQVGTYTLRVAAFDEGGGEDVQDITITLTATTPCVGDCNGDERVAIEELLTGVSIALGRMPVSECGNLDPQGAGTVGIAELVTATTYALDGCPGE